MNTEASCSAARVRREGRGWAFPAGRAKPLRARARAGPGSAPALAPAGGRRRRGAGRGAGRSLCAPRSPHQAA